MLETRRGDSQQKRREKGRPARPHSQQGKESAAKTSKVTASKGEYKRASKKAAKSAHASLGRDGRESQAEQQPVSSLQERKNGQVT